MVPACTEAPVTSFRPIAIPSTEGTGVQHRLQLWPPGDVTHVYQPPGPGSLDPLQRQGNPPPSPPHLSTSAAASMNHTPPYHLWHQRLKCHPELKCSSWGSMSVRQQDCCAPFKETLSLSSSPRSIMGSALSPPEPPACQCLTRSSELWARAQQGSFLHLKIYQAFLGETAAWL